MARVEKEIGMKLKCLRSDRGGESISNEFNEFFFKKGIKFTPCTPQQNGITERKNKIIMDCARTLMIEKNVVRKYWKEAISIIVHTLKQSIVEERLKSNSL